MYELKRLSSRTNLVEALERAKHYRDLNQPEEAESICRDVLDADPDQAEAWKTLGLALTDQFPRAWRDVFDEAQRVFAKLPSEFERVYYAGVAWERLGKAQLDAHQIDNAAFAFEQALAHYDRALAIDPSSADPVLRWNRCVRVLQKHPELVDVALAPRRPASDFGHYE